MKVTAIQVQQKKKERYNILLTKPIALAPTKK
ncbi:Uncharacterised protein [Listeria grayi]|uniref:Uncharacterized protein n=1 Tax=Listeria grayi TaxID=1641 RepID=A0A378M9J3_LISGR|nr:Uncharacterised protein [Listeria grayi]